MRDELRRLMQHLRWADERALESLRATPEPDALRRYAHVLGAEHTWVSRVRGQAPAVAIWPTLTLAECEALAGENAAALQAAVEALGEDDGDREVEYRNSAGAEFRSRVVDILLHVAMHGAYHRGQVALLVRAAGGEPQPTDYIAFMRGAAAATTAR